MSVKDDTSLSKPWLADDLLEWMAGILGPKSCVFEFGSGGSTVWFAKMAKRVFSLEQDKKRFALVSDALLPFREACVALVGNYTDIDNSHVGHYDLVLVDGPRPARIECTRQAMNLLRSGGWLVLDDVSYNVKYTRTLGVAAGLLDDAGWKRVDFTKGKHAAAWQKP